VYSKPRGSVICESATALGIFSFFSFSFHIFFFLIFILHFFNVLDFFILFFFSFLSAHPYLVDLGKSKIIKIKKKKKDICKTLFVEGVCVLLPRHHADENKGRRRDLN
jgi:hypothetical protein